jgi:hypothetical protein
MLHLEANVIVKEQIDTHAAVVSEMRLTVIRPLVDVSAIKFGRPAEKVHGNGVPGSPFLLFVRVT